MEARQKQINPYAPEKCGLCGNGAKREIEHPCPACGGRGTCWCISHHSAAHAVVAMGGPSCTMTSNIDLTCASCAWGPDG